MIWALGEGIQVEGSKQAYSVSSKAQEEELNMHFPAQETVSEDCPPPPPRPEHPPDFLLLWVIFTLIQVKHHYYFGALSKERNAKNTCTN